MHHPIPSHPLTPQHGHATPLTDDGEVVQLLVGAYVAQQLQPIHLWHHHVLLVVVVGWWASAGQQESGGGGGGKAVKPGRKRQQQQQAATQNRCVRQKQRSPPHTASQTHREKQLKGTWYRASQYLESLHATLRHRDCERGGGEAFGKGQLTARGRKPPSPINKKLLTSVVAFS